MARGEHAIRVAIAAVAREPHGGLDASERRAIVRIHQLRAGGEEHRVGQFGARAHVKLALARRSAIARSAAITAEPFAHERLMHHAEDRRSVAHEPDEGAPDRHSGDERFGAVDRVEHPDELGIGALVAVFLADNAVLRKVALDQRAHRVLGGAVGGRHRVETHRRALVLDAERGAEERQDRIAGRGRKLVDEGGEVDRGHERPVPVRGAWRNGEFGSRQLIAARRDCGRKVAGVAQRALHGNRDLKRPSPS